MLEKLKQRWKVNAFNLVLIICTFAFGGSLCGYAGRRLLGISGLEKGPVWFICYIFLVTLLWPLCVLIVSIPFGQFAFFKNYLIKMWNRIILKRRQTISIAVFASGAGSNAEKIIQQFNTPLELIPANRADNDTRSSGKHHKETKARVSLVVCNKPAAGVLQIAASYGIESLLIEKERFLNGDHYLPVLQQFDIGFIVLAGFLWKLPPALITAFPGKIVNIHPALLPKYGGKGMYGNKVHEAVIAAGEKESGITIHFVDELYDHGKVILQATCSVEENESPDSLARKIHSLEHYHYPETIKRLLNVK